MGTEDVPTEIKLSAATALFKAGLRASFLAMDRESRGRWGHQEFSLGPRQGQPTVRNKIRGPRRAPPPIPAAIPP